jgi:hypothetical protein
MPYDKNRINSNFVVQHDLISELVPYDIWCRVVLYLRHKFMFRVKKQTLTSIKHDSKLVTHRNNLILASEMHFESRTEGGQFCKHDFASRRS